MAAGQPIAATRVSGTEQVLDPGRSGLVVPPAEPEALAAALVALLADREAAAALGRAAQETVEREFSAARQAAQYLDLYRRLVEQP